MPARGDSGVVPLIRDARAGDAAALARLLAQLGYPAEADAVARRLETLGDDRLTVAEVDGRVVGFAQLHVSPSIEYERVGLEYTGRRYAKRLT